MKYKQELLCWLELQDDDAFMKWLQSQPLLEQTDIMRELKVLVEENLKEQGKFDEFAPIFENYDSKIDNYEDKILDSKLAKAQLNMAIEARDKQKQVIQNSFNEVREYIKECIETNAPNAQQMIEHSKQVIHYQKQVGLYNPKDWEFL